jgi:hypothetical protein
MSEGPWQLSGQWEATDESFSKSPFPGGWAMWPVLLQTGLPLVPPSEIQRLEHQTYLPRRLERNKISNNILSWIPLSRQCAYVTKIQTLKSCKCDSHFSSVTLSFCDMDLGDTTKSPFVRINRIISVKGPRWLINIQYLLFSLLGLSTALDSYFRITAKSRSTILRGTQSDFHSRNDYKTLH